MLYKQTVAEPTLELLKQLMALPELVPFSLVGGTNLALRLGHRISVDIDLFTPTEFDLTEVRDAIAQKFPHALELSARNQTLLYQINGVKTGLIRHQYLQIATPQQAPVDLMKISWPEVKASLRDHVRNYTSSILE